MKKTFFKLLTLSLALFMLLSVMTACKNDDVQSNGESNAETTKNISQTNAAVKDGSKVPQYLDGKVVSTVDVGEYDTLTCISDTNKEAYLEYVEQLEDYGFTLYMNNEINGNLYATYTSKLTMLHAYYVAHNNTVRLVSAPMNKTVLPPDVTQPKILKTHESSITQMILNYYEKNPTTDKANYGNCYVMVLNDGSLMIYDGGGKHGTQDADAERLWGLIQELGTKDAYGKIKIAAWFITHEHQDHIYGTKEVLIKYSKQLDIETIYCNTISEEAEANTDGIYNFINSKDMNTIKTAFANKVKIVRVHTGQKFFVRNAQIEILYTPEDIYPYYEKEFTDANDSSVVSRITVDGTTFLMLGDTGKIGAESLVAMYGDALKSDVCQVAHHGYSYAPATLYNRINADIYMLPTSESIFQGLVNGTGSMIQKYGWQTKRSMDLMISQVGENNIIRADHNNKTLVFATKEIIVRKTNNDQPGYKYGNKETNGYR